VSGRRIVVFGTPAQVVELCERAAAASARVILPTTSVVITGGGWKGGGWKGGGGRSRAELTAFVAEAFALPPESIIDTYSTSEINIVLMSCPHGRYHVPPVVEPVVVDDALTARQGPAVSGVLGILDPFALSYPGFVLTGDLVDLVWSDCPCGLDGWAIVGEICRSADFETKSCSGSLRAVSG